MKFRLQTFTGPEFGSFLAVVLWICSAVAAAQEVSSHTTYNPKWSPARLGNSTSRPKQTQRGWVPAGSTVPGQPADSATGEAQADYSLPRASKRVSFRRSGKTARAGSLEHLARRSVSNKNWIIKTTPSSNSSGRGQVAKTGYSSISGNILRHGRTGKSRWVERFVEWEEIPEGETLEVEVLPGVLPEIQSASCVCGGAGCQQCFRGYWRNSWNALWDNLTFYAGTQGFKGPLDVGANANFGFHEGFNLGGALFPHLGIGFQLGGAFAQSDLSGYTLDTFVDTSARTQSFATLGVFRRANQFCPWQLGVVWDWFDDNYAANINLSQIRGQLSYVNTCRQEFGFMVASNTNFDRGTFATTNFTAQGTDQFHFFYRHPLDLGGDIRILAGFTGVSDALLGADFRIPLSNALALRGSTNYLIPRQGNGVAGTTEESWGMGFSLVWYPRCGARSADEKIYRPLFNPADNSSFLVDVNIP